MIFLAGESTYKASDREAGPTQTDKSAAPRDSRPDAAAASPPEANKAEVTMDALPIKTEALPPVASDGVTGKRAVIKVIGVGGGGGNAVNRMIDAGVTGVDFIAANTDAQVLELSKAPVKIQLGIERTGGLGCGGDPEVGRLAASDDINRLVDVLAGADMVFITVGEGGGTGTGAAPVIACVARETKALCIAVATKPLTVEGKRRRTTSNDGLRELREFVDTLICVPNDRVVEVYGNLQIGEAFRCADDVVRQTVQGISDLIQVPGEINLDFADVRSAMRLSGDAVMGIGQASGDGRVEEATEAAISSPLLKDTSIEGASSIIVNVTGGESLTLNEVQRVVEVVRDAAAPEDGTGVCGSADTEPGDNILIGTALDPKMDGTGEIKVTVVATGFPDRSRAGATPTDFANYTNRATGTFGSRGAIPTAGRSGPVAQADRAPGGRVGRTIPKMENFSGSMAGRTIIPRLENFSGGRVGRTIPKLENVSSGRVGRTIPKLENVSGGKVDRTIPKLENVSGGKVGRTIPKLENVSGGKVGRTIPKLGNFSGGRVGRTIIRRLANFSGGSDAGPSHGEAATADVGAADQAGSGVNSRGASGPRLVVDEPMSLPEDVGDERWGDLETPPYLHRRR